MNMKRIQAYFCLIISVLLSGACQSPRPVIRIVTDKRTLQAGDSMLLTWEVKNQKRATSVQIGDTDYGMQFTGNAVLKPGRDTVVIATVFSDKHKPHKTRKKIQVIVPEINLFEVYRDRFNPEKITFTWSTENTDTVYIEGKERVLEPAGSFWEKGLHEGSYTLVAKTKFRTLTKKCVIGAAYPERTFILSDTSAIELSDNREFIFNLFETDVSEFPRKVKLRAVVNDTAGNFIQDLAPPFNTEDFARKYFKKLVQTVNNTTQEVEFTVREIRKSPEVYDIALTLDYSGSMEDAITDLEQATEYFINGKYPDDRIALTKFDHRIVDACDLRKDASEILQKAKFAGIDTLGGSTAMYAAIGNGLYNLRNAKNKKVVLLFTDGHENSSMNYLGLLPCTINQVVNQCRGNNAKLIIVGLGKVQNTLLRELAYYTNGSFYPIHNPESIIKVFNEFQYLSHSYYEIEYKPLNEEGEHTVRLTYYGNRSEGGAERPFYIGHPVDFGELEVDTSAYWFSKSLHTQKFRPVTAPQVIVNFDFDMAEMDATQKNTLKKIATYLNNHPGSLIKIYGHTDREGSEDYNYSLSQRRADAVRDELLKLYLDPARMECFYLGETQPLWPDETTEWAAWENRRVEIVIWEK